MSRLSPDSREQTFDFETVLGEEVVEIVGTEFGRYNFQFVKVVTEDGVDKELKDFPREIQSQLLEEIKEHCDELYRGDPDVPCLPPGRDPAEWDYL